MTTTSAALRDMIADRNEADYNCDCPDNPAAPGSCRHGIVSVDCYEKNGGWMFEGFRHIEYGERVIWTYEIEESWTEADALAALERLR